MTAKNRLSKYKAKAEKARSEQCKNWRFWYTKPDRKTWYLHEDGNIHPDTLDSFGKYLGDVHGVMQSSPFVYRKDYPFGYYTDECGDSTLIGFVSVLKTGKFTLYIPGTRLSDSDCITLHMKDAEKVEKGADKDTHERAKYEAAKTADGIADCLAEKEREYNEAYEKGRRFSEKGAEIKELKKEFLTIRREYKQARNLGDFPALCTALKIKLISMLRVIRNLKKEREDLADCYSWQLDAFNAGKADFY